MELRLDRVGQRWLCLGSDWLRDAEIKKQPNGETDDEEADFNPAQNPVRPLGVLHFEVQQSLPVGLIGGFAEAHAPQSAAQKPDA